MIPEEFFERVCLLMRSYVYIETGMLRSFYEFLAAANTSLPRVNITCLTRAMLPFVLGVQLKFKNMQSKVTATVTVTENIKIVVVIKTRTNQAAQLVQSGPSSQSCSSWYLKFN